MSSSRQKRKVAVEDNGIKDGEAREEDFYISEDGIGDVSTTSFALTDPSDMEEGQEKEEEEEEEVVLNPSDILEHRMLDQDRVLLGFKVGAEFFFKGSMQIKVLKGVVSVQGYELEPRDEYTSIYSPRGYSLLSISGTKEGNSDAELEDRLASERIINASTLNSSILFIAKKLTEPWMEYLKKNLKKAEKINLFGRDLSSQDVDELQDVEKCLDITLFRPDRVSTKLWKQGEEWGVSHTSMQLVRREGEQPRLLVAGGKGVGKSSFLRWLTNRLVKEGKVLYLDLDPGQREFGLPGYLSLSLISHPLLGPSFCQPETEWTKSIYFGDINVSNNPGRYIHCVKKLLKFAEEYGSLPLLANTMGWAQGLGCLLTTDVIRLIRPSTVVQLYSRFSKKNFSCSLSSDYVSETNSSWSKIPKPLRYSLLEFSAVPESRSAKDMRSRDSWGIPEPGVLRDIQTLSWFGRRGGITSIPVHSIHFSQVCLNVAHARVPNNGLLAALLLKPVDLCRVDEEKIMRPKHSDDYSVLNNSPVVESLGVGVVRGVDEEKRLIFVSTDIGEAHLQTVNCIVGGCLTLPGALFSQQKVPSPYICEEPGNPLSLPWQRNHRYGQFSQ
ncbi:polynucleotide 5'-hydroxyl-kinase NOL9 [Eurytemora carolleeae]|uniref:polynucleotide 5'-hydroxyl-kinase NOL9 n=1 Tax=Eurytemora carolleeae TaxID=1294199 RepID=UPI000C794F2C|nr:polynucleotide 5'-hydroxyl-kinase NOL9 [Eurytemora carolleeae]|eukprot:XP_023343250.1 polynucleotide 5'-hydroxyl-kinase NOL9-like [Eurytemora affinis]